MAISGLSDELCKAAFDAYEQHGGNATRAAQSLGLSRSTFRDRLRTAQMRARSDELAAHIVKPDPVIDGFGVSKVSTLYGPDGDVKAQWVQQKPEAVERQALFVQHIEALCEQIKGIAPLQPIPAFTNAELLAVYPIGDHHYGMLADKRETGDDWDCKIASTILDAAVGHLSHSIPQADEALLINVGDFYHADNSDGETRQSGNKLDMDTRWDNILEGGAFALIRAVERLLERHRIVRVWNVRGNHDPDASLALNIAMKCYFWNEPRVITDSDPKLYKAMKFGRNLIASHHGHGAKGSDLPLIMATDYAEWWGETDHRVWHCGHIHHETKKEYSGCTVETHKTLAAKDAWHAGKGYRSKRGMSAIVYHRELGELQRTQFHPGMMLAA